LPSAAVPPMARLLVMNQLPSPDITPCKRALSTDLDRWSANRSGGLFSFSSKHKHTSALRSPRGEHVCTWKSAIARFFDISYGGILVLAIEDAQEMFQLRTVCVHVYECWGCGPSQHVFTICQIWAPFDPGEMIEKEWSGEWF
jgi:hypothetical protein